LKIKALVGHGFGRGTSTFSTELIASGMSMDQEFLIVGLTYLLVLAEPEALAF